MKSSARSPVREKVLRNVPSSQSGLLHQLPGQHDVPRHKPVGMIWNSSWLHMARSYTDKNAGIWNGVQRQHISLRFVSTGRFGSSRPAVFLKKAAASWETLSYQAVQLCSATKTWLITWEVLEVCSCQVTLEPQEV